MLELLYSSPQLCVLYAEPPCCQNLGVADFVLATAAIAQDWMSAMAYERALAALAQLPLAQLDPGSKAVVTRMEADIHAWYVPVSQACLRVWA